MFANQLVGVLLVVFLTIGAVSAYAHWLDYRHKVKEFAARVAVSQEETARMEIMFESMVSELPRRITAIAIQHDLTDMQIYNIIKQQRKLNMKRKQSELFPE